MDQLETAVTEDDMNGAHNVVFEVTRGGKDLALAYAATVLCLNSGNWILRSVGLRALGDIARVFDTLDERYKDVLEEALVDPDRYVREEAESAAMDLYSFLSWHFKNWTPKGPPEPMDARFEDLPDDGSGPVRRGNNPLVEKHFRNSDQWRMIFGRALGKPVDRQ